MPHVNHLYNVIRSKNTDCVLVQTSVIHLKKIIYNIRNDMTNICQYFSEQTDFEYTPNRKRIDDTINSRKWTALEVCDVISAQIEKRFVFTKHLTAAQLFQNEKYAMYHNWFLITALDTTVKCYSFFNKDRLRIKLEVLYSRNNFCNLSAVIAIINYIINNKMENTFKEVFQILKLLVVTPMTSSEAERNFSTSKKIETC